MKVASLMYSERERIMLSGLQEILILVNPISPITESLSGLPVLVLNRNLSALIARIWI